jgi:acyl dehydratase
VSPVEHLDGPPRLGPRYARALLPHRGGDILPDREVGLDGVRVDPGGLAGYARVCGFPVDGALPLTYPQVLGFAAQVHLMTSPGFPLKVAGLVHLRQRIRQERSIGADEPLDLRVRAADLRAHPRGRQVDLLTDVSVHGEPVWHGRSTYLARGSSPGGSPGGAAAAEDPEPAAPPGGAPAARWRLPADTGRRYAAVSGDVNPIHLNPLAARLFGFPGAIAHGMWTAARCLAALQGRLPDRVAVDVVFGKPVVLPADVTLRTGRDGRGPDAGWLLELRGTRDERWHLVAACGSAAREC